MSNSQKFYRWLAKGAFGRVCVLALIMLAIGLIFERWWWVADACAQLRLHNAVVLILLGTGFAATRRWKWLATAAAGALIGLVLSLPPHFQSAPGMEKDDGPVLKILCHNLEFDNRDFDAAIAAIKAADADVVILLEVTAGWREQLEGLEEIYDHHVIEAEGGQFGIAMFSKLKTAEFKLEDFSGLSIQSIIATLEFGGEKITIIGTHPPPPVGADLLKVRNWHLESLARDIAGRREPVIVVGDLNITPASSGYRNLLGKTGLRSAGMPWRASWSPFGIPGISARLDHTLVSRQWRVVSSKVGPASGSDHRMLVTELALVLE